MELSERILDEFAGAAFPDERLNRRLKKIVKKAVCHPGVGFPRMMQNDSALEGLYRFLNNPRVTFEALLQPHVEATASRVAQAIDVLAIHDTTKFAFSGDGEREGLGQTPTGGQGFDGHFALAVSNEPVTRPLGVLGVRTIFRKQFAHRKREQNGRGYADPEKESNRWLDLVDDVERRAAQSSAKLVHVMDREADWFELLQSIDRRGSRFVVRAMHDRRLAEPLDTLLSDALVESTWHETREVRISRRRKGDRPLNSLRKHPPRDTRLAQLAISARSVVLSTPKNARLTGAVTGVLRLQVVHVQEIESPLDEDPVEWILLTNLPIATTDEVLRVVDIYRARWMIEEFFKALKTGCAFERRQLESKHALLNALALLVPLAWGMFALRTTARVDSARPASEILSKRQIQVLRAMYTKPLLANPTVGDALYAIAAIGGHLRNNGFPGWQTLGAGFEQLLQWEHAWAAATKQCDQS
jgi:hypothetical protein